MRNVGVLAHHTSIESCRAGATNRQDAQQRFLLDCLEDAGFCIRRFTPPGARCKKTYRRRVTYLRPRLDARVTRKFYCNLPAFPGLTQNYAISYKPRKQKPRFASTISQTTSRNRGYIHGSFVYNKRFLPSSSKISNLFLRAGKQSDTVERIL